MFIKNKKNENNKLSKKDLLEILVLQSKKIDELEKKLEEKEGQLISKGILIENAGSIAEAALQINKVFEVAQAAADQYLENIKNLEQKSVLKGKKGKNKAKAS